MIIDGSLYANKDDFARADRVDNNVYVGYVKTVIYSSVTPYAEYLVEVIESPNNIKYLKCEAAVKFGGPFNYEQIIHNPYTGSGNPGDMYKNDLYKAGTKVIVVSTNGSSTVGFILGALCHGSNTAHLTSEDGIAYISEFNGVETSINNSGEYTLTFKGLPTNINEVDQAPSTRTKTIPAPQYDDAISGSYFKFLYEGSVDISDNADQRILINKQAGTIYIKSGDNSFIFNKDKKTCLLDTSDLTIIAKNSIKESTQEFRVDASKSFLVSSPKVALGTTETELLRELIKMVDALGSCTPIDSLAGKCAPMTSSPQWGSVESAKNNIDKIRGAL